MSTTPSSQHAAAPLRASHERLAALVTGLDEDALLAPSYDDDWSIGKVLSHLGSQAEIFDLMVAAAAAGEPVPGNEVFGPVWERWDAKAPVQWRDDLLRADRAHLERVESLDPDVRIPLFGTDYDVAGYVRFRLAEHAVHTWDVAVALDPAATVSPDAVALLLDGLGATAARAGRGSATPFRVRVGTTDPARDLVVTVADGVTIAPAEQDDSYDGSVDLPAEAFLRLVTGRLDPDHTPPFSESGARGLADLRAAFPGY
ncbi:MAG: maleylpyruvate isomerase family mycothiol-dependent enzyme [Frankiales bacterium]|nr:maleylpyruvate isomerase family mycothiol-dependent enzyme [Frankiales bacterium]